MMTTFEISRQSKGYLLDLLGRNHRRTKVGFLAICAAMIVLGPECGAQPPGANGVQPSAIPRYASQDPIGGAPVLNDPFAGQAVSKGQAYLETDKVKQALAAIQEARKAMQQAAIRKDEGAIVKHQEQLKNAIQGYLKQDMEASETQLQRLRDQLADLESSHKKRAAARQELIELQLQAMLLAKQGLSIPTSSNASALPQGWLTQGNPSMPGMGAPGMGMPGAMMGGAGPGLQGSSSLLGGGASALGGGGSYEAGGGLGNPFGNGPGGSGYPMSGDSVDRTDRRSYAPQERAQLQNLISSAWKLLQDAEDDSQEKQAMDLLRDSLSKYFDFDLEQREWGLKMARQEIEKLDKKLQKRKSLTDSMVELQMKVELNESMGLGFFSTSNGRSTISP